MKTILPRILAKLIFVVGVFVFVQNSFAGDISFFGIIKEQDFFQTNNAAPSSDTNSPFLFQCFVDSSGPDLIDSASVQLPNSSSRILQPEGNDEFAFREIFSSLSGLNATYGTGTYSLTIDSENDFNVVQVNFPSDAYPSTPQITNYTAAQAINPSNNFTLAWLPFAGGTVNDFIELRIEGGSGDAVFRSADFGAPDSLNGTNVSVLIPANTLSPGETYHGELMFAHPTTVDTTSIPNATGVIAFTKRTGFELKTTGTPPSINLQIIGITNGNFQFSFNTQPGKDYQVQFTQTLTNWQDIGFFNATTNQIIFSDTFSIFNTGRIYRVFTP
jgi:hypothetical protein